MRNILIALIAVLLLFPAANAADLKCRNHVNRSFGTVWSNDHVDIDLDDGTIILKRQGRSKDRVEITENYELFVNEEQIDLDEDQQKLVKEFYDGSIALIDTAAQIGIEGAKIGLSGAALGLKAIGGVFKMIFTEYESEDFEDDMEDQAEEIEDRAEELEERAEELEDMAENVADVFYDMRREIPEIPRWCKI